ncbi:MAG: universal stress protein [Verrucomicrobiae bacterium]|nr:universal stress protein [Verrucomicrobiae bacterium]NNJ42843.1 universal stress protein [Akkermansiaceae bacterium]
MKRFRKILVPLTFTEADASVLAMTSHLAKWSQPDEIVFCHFNPKVKIPAALQKSHPWLLEPMDEAARERMKEFVHQHSELPENTTIGFHVEEANPVLRTLSLVLEMDCDLVITGADTPEIAIRLARKAPCSVCIVPAGAPTSVRKPMVAVDFSDYSRYACEIGLALSDASQGEKPVLLHLSKIHRGYHWGAISREEFIANNESHAAMKMDEFSQSLDAPKDSFTTAVHHHEFVPYGILDYVNENDIDCIVAGCRGKDALSAILLGSDIEQIMHHSSVPVLAVKTKGTGRSFLEGLLGKG